MEKAKKKHSKFFVAAWILTGLFVLAISVILLILWNFLAAFEKSDPRHYIDEVVTAIEQQRYSEAAALSHFEESRFFTEKQYEAYIKETLGEGTKLKVMEAKRWWIMCPSPFPRGKLRLLSGRMGQGRVRCCLL